MKCSKCGFENFSHFKFCGNCGEKLSDLFEEKKVNYYYICDLSGFTSLSRNLNSEDVREVVNICFDYFNKVILNHGGTIHKYEGDLVILSRVKTLELINNLLKEQGLVRNFLEEIISKAGGNPFYLEEIIRSLIDGGYLVFEEGGWKLSSYVYGLVIPDNVQAMIISRLDRLNRVTKFILQVASVIGRNFYENEITKSGLKNMKKKLKNL